MIDFERAELRAGNDEAARSFMLAKIDRELAGAPIGDRMRFLHAYSHGDRSEARQWWHRVADVAPALARRDFRRIARNATRDGRRFQRLAHADWRGFAVVGSESSLIVESIDARATSAAAVCVDARPGTWRIFYRGVRHREARRLWVTANFLWKRGELCPRPLALWARSGEAILVLERAPETERMDRTPEARTALGAARVLVRRIRALAEIRAPIRPEMIGIGRAPAGNWRAQLLSPRGVWVGGRASRHSQLPQAELLNGVNELLTVAV